VYSLVLRRGKQITKVDQDEGLSNARVGVVVQVKYL
jgi:hypothetical protein